MLFDAKAWRQGRALLQLCVYASKNKKTISYADAQALIDDDEVNKPKLKAGLPRNTDARFQ